MSVFEVECIDRMYLNVYQPKLQYAAGSGRLRPSAARYADRLDGAAGARSPTGSSRAVHRFAKTEGIEWVDFVKGERKDDVMQDRLEGFTAPEGVVFIGRAQEKNTVFRTEKRRHPDGSTYPWIVKTTGVINQFYFYCVDTDFGPFFLKFCSYFPYTGETLHQRKSLGAAPGREGGDRVHRDGQRVRRGGRPGRVAADLRPARPGADPGAAGQVAGDPAEPVHRGGHRRRVPVQLSILQAEFSLTQMLDNPVSGRVFFEQVIRENLDIGRPGPGQPDLRPAV